MSTIALITMITAWTVIISLLSYFLSKAMRTQKKPQPEEEES
ncbi:MAG: hypothetical protein QY308_08840 [Ignavibacteriaceae bacterium]|nr:MAG: hypothetical protein QY308_08840 [Ignavibacteriaceae bacterium]